MTTIAYKDGELAADSLICTDNGMRVAQINKIASAENGMIGIAGQLGDVTKMREWLLSGADHQKLPDFSKGSSAIYISPKGGVHLIEHGVVTKVQTNFIATGSGEEIATAAMMAGASAKKAVKIARKLDCYSGGAVKTLRFARPKPSRPGRSGRLKRK